MQEDFLVILVFSRWGISLKMDRSSVYLPELLLESDYYSLGGDKVSKQIS